jgi:hypothetical protein
VVGAAYQGGGKQRRVVLEVEEAHLGHFQQAANQGRHGVAGNAGWPGRWPAGKASPASSNHRDKHQKKMSRRERGVG